MGESLLDEMKSEPRIPRLAFLLSPSSRKEVFTESLQAWHWEWSGELGRLTLGLRDLLSQRAEGSVYLLSHTVTRSSLR